ncbi:hypothetical protein HHI36_005935 [Cryptolaemus montrouzieri]|uniref:Nuclear pore protein n=1 Tax=Cryptolaemus montrouzieri TaxID=559131 RepID=A0ABD2NVT1_9CUCU
MSDFSELLQEAEKLTTNLEGTTELPKVERSLRQVLEASNELYSRVAQTGAKDIQANLLLGSKGIDLPKIVQKLESISTKRTFEPIEPVEDLDLGSLLENEVRNCILSVVESGYSSCLKSVYDNAWEHQAGEWKQEKRKILNSMIAPSGSFLELGSNKSIFMEPSAPTAPFLGVSETLYATKIIEYNNSVAKNSQQQDLVSIFMKISQDFKDAKVKDMWEMIKYMIDLPPFPHSDDPIKMRYSKPIINALVHQGKKYLEDRYKTYMNNIINENLTIALRGGIPGTYHMVRSFVGIRLQGEYYGLNDGTIEDRPIWPMVYYCLRAGDLNAAIYCLKKHNSDFKEIINILEAKTNNASCVDYAKLEASVRFAYRRMVRNETDPFKRIIWAVLGCCDIVDEHSEVARTADDYLWLKLSLVRTDYDKEDHIKYEDLQRMILEDYGESHYDAYNQPHLYFQMLLLTGQFEAALEFLARIEKYKVHSVHMAIALKELYLLGGPYDPSAPLISVDPMDPKPARRLNIARLILIYVKKFEMICFHEALHYFFILRNIRDSEGTSLFQMCTRDLALETKCYEQILGKVQRNGVRSKGLIDQFSSSAVTAESIAEITADALCKKGLFEDAIELYDIANKQDMALNLLCSLLSQVVQIPPQAGSLRDRLQQKSYELAERYEREGYKSSTIVVVSFLKLKDLLTFFDYYHSKQFNLALKTLGEIQIIPLQSHEFEERVKAFDNLSIELCKVIPDIVLATMNMLFAQYQKLKGNEYMPSKHKNEATENQLIYLRQQAKTLTDFAGLLPYRMPGDTNSRLVQMEILMH